MTTTSVQPSTYQYATDLIQTIRTLTRQFPQMYKASLGQEVQVESIALANAIFNLEKNSSDTLHYYDLEDRMEMLQLRFGVCRSFRLINATEHQTLLDLVLRIRKQLFKEPSGAESTNPESFYRTDSQTWF